MRTFQIICVLVFFICSSLPLYAGGQMANMTGVVIDSRSGEKIIGATIKVVGTSKGAKTNINGEFRLQIDPGSYSLKITCLGYQPKIIENAELKANESKHVDIALDVEAVKGEEIVVTGKVESETQTAQLLARKNSSTMNDFISGEQIRRSPDATSSDALKRVSGVSIVDNKFVQIRGTSERYNNATLNGAALASTEPDKKAFSFDLLPANLIDNTVVAKTFTPDLPANFSGGLVQVNTVNFPDKFNARISISGGYNSFSTGKTFLSYQTGGTDWLASDDGTRALPSGFPDVSVINGKNITSEETQKYGLLFKNNWSTREIKAAANSSFAFSAGDVLSLWDNEFGYIASLSYKNNSEKVDIVRNTFNPDGTGEFARSGTNNTNSVLWGGLLNLTYKLGERSTVSFRNLYDRSADDQVVYLSGADSANGYQDKQISYHYTQRSLYSGQLGGEHSIEDLNNTKVEWRLSHTASSRSEPDLRRIVFERALDAQPNDPYYAALSVSADPKTGGRFFSNMSEQYNEGGLDLTVPVSTLKFKLGGLLGSRARDFSARVLAFKSTNSTPFTLLYSSIDTLFAANHIGPQGYEIAEITNPSDKYDASEHIGSGYAMLELPFAIAGEKFRFIGGARMEADDQKLNSGDVNGSTIHFDKKHTDILPSLNLIYSVDEKINIRLAATQTISRPEFREIAPFAFYDFETGSTIQGDTNIDRALIRNLDFRIEFYPTAGELLSLSIFHKRFEGAIEATDQGSNNIKSWANAKQPAINYGLELEVRKSLRFIGDFFSNFTISGNWSLIKSEVNVHDLTNGQQEFRPMQGQSPFTLNLGLLYSTQKLGTTINLLYNVFGKRIEEVNPYSGDLYEMPRSVVDLSISQQISERFELKYSIKDMLAQKQLFESNGLIERSNQRGSNTFIHTINEVLGDLHVSFKKSEYLG